MSIAVFRHITDNITGAFGTSCNTASAGVFQLLLVSIMDIKEKIPDVTYTIRYSRCDDVQKTELVDVMSEAEIKSIILTATRDKFIRASQQKPEIFTSWTLTQLWKNDNVLHQSKMVCMFPKAYNLSPREVRIRVEKLIRQHSSHEQE